MPRIKRDASLCDRVHEDFEEDTCFKGSEGGHPPFQRNAANARERARMRVLSSAFGRLKTKLPNIPPDTKLSKLDTLRLATIYIKQLKTLAEGGTENNPCDLKSDTSVQREAIKTHFQSSSPNMTWPFVFQHMHTNRNLASHVPANWVNSIADAESTNGTENNTFTCSQMLSDEADLYQNTQKIISNSATLSNCLQQQQHNPFPIRDHCSYQTDCADYQYSDNPTKIF